MGLAIVSGIFMFVDVTYNIGYKDGYETVQQDIQKTPEISFPAKKEKSPNNNYLLDYFDKDELETISIAALRNDCRGDNFLILLAIRKSEAGKNGNEFGIKNPEANNLDKQAGWAAATIVKNRKRWIDSGKKIEFIEFLGNRYCPTTGNLTEKEKELNKNWVKNVTSWYEKLKPQ